MSEKEYIIYDSITGKILGNALTKYTPDLQKGEAYIEHPPACPSLWYVNIANKNKPIVEELDEPIIIKERLPFDYKIKNDPTIQQFKDLTLEESVNFFESLNKKEQNNLIATLLCFLIKDK